MNDRFRYLLHWCWSRIKLTTVRDSSSSVWFLIIFWLTSSAVAIMVAMGSPTGVGWRTHVLDIVKVLGLNSLGFIVIIPLVAALLSFLYVPLPRLVFSGFLYVGILSGVVFHIAKSGLTFSIIIGVMYSLIAVLLGYFLVCMARFKMFRLVFSSILCIGIIGIGVYYLSTNGQEKMAVQTTDGELPKNPGETGDYNVSFFTYGSGTDVQRDEFGAKVDEVTPVVDASDLVTKWSTKRKAFWEFGPEDIPLNGRVWMPEGEGPFPIILMVHGNHTMEYFSTDGYDYLGKQLASKGFIFVAVDEDFINYSNISGQPNDNYQFRAWVLLQHVLQLKEMNAETDSLLYKQIDFDHVALGGHSRGGQAAPMAADYEEFFDDPELLQGLQDVHFDAVAAIAPTDKLVDGKRAALNNMSYIVLQGAQDADVSDFRGAKQYDRTTFDAGADAFKTALYVAHANHTQFNTSWGRMDLSLPKGIFLNRIGLLSPEEQQQIAKVYLTAFFERVFHQNKDYDALFKEDTFGGEWLPDTTFVQQYRDGSYQTVKQYGEDAELGKLENFTSAKVITPENRAGNKHNHDALALQWQDQATYELQLKGRDVRNAIGNYGDHLVLTVANMDTTSIPTIGVELMNAEGDNMLSSTEHQQQLAPVIETDYTPYGVMDDIFREGKYDTSWEPIYQTIEIPLKDYNKMSLYMTDEDDIQLRIHFGDEKGKLILRELGID